MPPRPFARHGAARSASGRCLPSLLSLWSLLVGLSVLCGGLLACSYDQTLIVVDLGSVPPATLVLHVQAQLDGQAATQPIDLPPDALRFGVRIPKDRRGLLQITVEARDDKSCVLARGSGELSVEGGMEYALSISLAALPAAQCELRVKKTGDGGGQVRVPVANIDCGSSCSGYAAQGQSVVLSAQADSSSHFLGWSGPCNGTSDCTLPIQAAVEVRALFIKRQATLCPQPGWCWENPRLQGSTQLKIWGSSPRDLWSVGAVGTILHFDGQSWVATPSGTSESIQRIFGVSGGDLWAVGTRGTVLRFREGSWTAVASPVTGNLNAVFGFAENDLWAVGANAAILHFDGQAWTAVTPTGTPPAGTVLNALWGSNSSDLWAVGSNGAVLHYDGRVWTLGSPIGTLNLQSIAGSSPGNVWAVSAEGSLVRYNGTVWQVQMPSYAQALQDVAVASSSQGWIVGSGGLTLRWEGSKWTQYLSNASQDLRGVWVDPSAEAWTVGNNGTLLRWQSVTWSN